MSKSEIKKVINGDTMKCLETFDERETKEKLEYYRSLGEFSEVETDLDGDIICYENE